MPSEHAILSASGAHRWLHCTAAPRFEATFPAGTSVYAEEGTLAHSVCERRLRARFAGASDADLTDLRQDPLWQDEMLETSKAYVDYAAECYAAIGGLFPSFETRVDLGAYVPHGFGTCDCVLLGREILQIIDYKHGKGVIVGAEQNPQMMLYALGALDKYQPINPRIRTVRMAIVQPRISDTPSEWELPVERLREWGQTIAPIAQRAYTGDGAEFCPGDWCRFCRGAAQCRARAKSFDALHEFAGIVPPPKGEDPKLSDQEIGELLTRAKGLAGWVEALEQYVFGRVSTGGRVPGWKIVEGRSNRVITDPDKAVAKLTGAGYDEAMLYERKMRTLTELEKLVGKKRFGELMDGLVVKPAGKPTLAPETDNRPAITSAAADFGGVANGKSN